MIHRIRNMNIKEEEPENSVENEPRAPLIVIPFVDEDESSSNGQQTNNTMVYFSTLVAVCGSLAYGTCIGYSSTTQTAIRKDLSLTIAEYAWFGAVLSFGGMIGAITSGHLADLLGRKGAMRVGSCFCAIGWLAIFSAQGHVSLDIGRISTGYGMGIFSYTVPVFIAEISPKNLRGALTTTHELMSCIGVAIVNILGTVLAWRQLAITGLIPCAIMLFGLFLIPESPRWLAKMGNKKGFEVSLRKFRGKDADISEEAAEIQDYIETLEKLPKANILDLFQRRYLRSVIIGVGLMTAQMFVGINAIIFYASSIFESAGKDLWNDCNRIPIHLLTDQRVSQRSQNSIKKSDDKHLMLSCFTDLSLISIFPGFPSNMGVIIISIIPIVVVIMAGSLFIEQAGRKPLLLVSGSGLVIGCLLTALSFYFTTYQIAVKTAPALALTGLLVYVGFFDIGMGPVPWVVMSEIFPINVKGSAGSLAALAYWLSNWVVSYSFNFLMAWSSYGTFLLYAGVNMLVILFVMKVVPETKGKTLEKIQTAINSQ